MSLPTAAEVAHKASRLAVLAQQLDQLAPGLEVLSPGIREVLQDTVDTLVEESRRLAEVHQWMCGAPPGGVVPLSEWLRESRMIRVRTDSRSHSPVRGTEKRRRQS